MFLRMIFNFEKVTEFFNISIMRKISVFEQIWLSKVEMLYPWNEFSRVQMFMICKNKKRI